MSVSPFTRDKQPQSGTKSSDTDISSVLTAIVNDFTRENTPMEIIKPIDQRRILLTNVPIGLDYDYLELYLEYLSDEIEVERIDLGEEIPNSIVVTFKKFFGRSNISDNSFLF